MSCKKPKELKKYSNLLDKSDNYFEWENIMFEIDEICLDIAECKKKCGNEYCQGLQKTW